MNEIKYIEARAQGIARYSDKLRTEMRHFDDGLIVPFKIAGIRFIGKTIHTETNVHGGEINYALKITEIDGVWGIYVRKSENWTYEDEYQDFSEVSRVILKKAALEIIPFLTAYSKSMKEALIDFHDLSQKVERMAQAISQNTDDRST